MTQTKLAQLIGTSPSQISQIENEHAGTSMGSTMAAAQALNVSMDYLVGFVDDPTPTRKLVVNLRAKTARLVDVGAGDPAEEEEDFEFNSDDFVGVDKIVASAGTGAEVISEQITDRVQFRRSWMRSHGMKPYLCRIVTVTGESMEPTLPDGTSILVNMGQQEPREGRIFVLRIEDEILVKRLIRDPDAGWLVQNDNRNKRAWPTRPWPDDAQIVGQVKWLGRTFT